MIKDKNQGTHYDGISDKDRLENRAFREWINFV